VPEVFAMPRASAMLTRSCFFLNKLIGPMSSLLMDIVGTMSERYGVLLLKHTVAQKGNAHVTHFTQFGSCIENIPFATVLCGAL
jgi:hypothetical protein